LAFFINKHNLTNRKIALLGISQATCTLLYVLFVATTLIFLIPTFEELFPEDGKSLVTLVLASGFIMFFIASASITGILVFGYPVILALHQQLKEAILLVSVTIFTIILFILILTIVLGILAIIV